jgi:WD40 repeat protein
MTPDPKAAAASPQSDGPPPQEQEYAAFASYSTDPDHRLVLAIESFLESLDRNPLLEPGDRRAIQLCVDGSDFTLPSLGGRTPGADPDALIRAVIEPALERSGKLLVFCCPESRQKKWPSFELDWFLANRPHDEILLAVTGGDPVGDAASVFPEAAIHAGLTQRQWFDFRGFYRSPAERWRGLRDFDLEKVRLAAHLLGEDRAAGRILPIYRIRAARLQRRRRILGALAVLVVILLTLYLLGLRQRARHEGESEHLARLSLSLSSKEPLSALISAMEAFKTFPTQSARDQLLRATNLPVPRALLHHGTTLEAAAFSPDGSRALTVGGGKAVLWSSLTGRELHRLDLGPAPLAQVLHGPKAGQITILLTNGVTKIVDLATGTSLESLRLPPGLTAACFAPNGTIVAGHEDGAVSFSMRSGKLLRRVPGRHLAAAVRAVACSGFDSIAATGSDDGRVVMWSTETMAPLAFFNFLLEQSVDRVEWAGAERVFMLSGPEIKGSFYDLGNNLSIAQFGCITGGQQVLAVPGQRLFIVTCRSGDAVRPIHAERMRLLALGWQLIWMQNLERPVVQALAAAEGRVLALLQTDSLARWYAKPFSGKREYLEERAFPIGDGIRTQHLAVSENGNLLMTVDSDEIARVWFTSPKRSE